MRSNVFAARLVLGAALALAFAGPVGATVYVAPSPIGNDTTGDGSPIAPYATIQFAYDQAPVQGETIVVAPGTFNECVNATGLVIETSPGVFQAKWVKIRANHPDPSLTTINGDGLCATVTVGGLNGSLEGFTVTGGGDSGVHGIGTVTIKDNIVTGNTGFDGGGIRLSSATCDFGSESASVTGNTITANLATNNGGGLFSLSGIDALFCQAASVTVLVQGNTIENNDANDDGGGAQLRTAALPGRSAQVTVTGNVVRNNRALSLTGNGGGLRVRAAGSGLETIQVRDNIVELNQAGANGGGIVARIDAITTAQHTVVVDNNTVTGNTAGSDGGGMVVKTDVTTMAAGQRYDFYVTNNLVDGNLAGGGRFGGGGVLARYESEASLLTDAASGVFVLEGNIITGNTCQLVGGGLSISVESNIDEDTVDGCSITTFDASAHIDVVNSLIARNVAQNPFPAARGGGVALLNQACTSSATSATTSLSLNTIVNNETTTGAGGVELGYFTLNGGFAGVTISDSAITNNQGAGVGGLTPSGNYGLEIFYSNVALNAGTNYSIWIPNPTGSNGNIVALPRYVDPDNDDYHLRFDSPMIDAGTLVFGDPPLTDLDGSPRVVDGDEDGLFVVDMGYDEYFVCEDADLDGFGDPILAGDHCQADNCPSDYNPGQSDCDLDLIGDACDPDAVDLDGDGVADGPGCDSDDGNPVACGDFDGDGCEDCLGGVAHPGNDGLDTDNDGLCDLGDPDDDNDGFDDVEDSDPIDPFRCRDLDGDTCDDCVSGVADPAEDGADFDGDGLCDAGDPDDDNDGVDDATDNDPFNPNSCGDTDLDGCEDCSGGEFDPLNDGTDVDGDGRCAPGDSNDADPNVCVDVDADGCDDCSNGLWDPANDGNDLDSDGLCDLGDPDDDNDGVDDVADPAPTDPDLCGDSDGDSCDDCSTGTDDLGPLSDVVTIADGPDLDADGLCDAGDLDDDGDGVDDVADADPLDPTVCADTDADGCDDCSGGIPKILDAHFDLDEQGLVYVDDAFRATAQPAYADGTYETAGGMSGGGLRVVVGGTDDAGVLDMSGAWRVDFVLDADAEVSLSFLYNMVQSATYESDELSQVLLAVDDVLLGEAPDDYVAQIVGDGDSGSAQTTGWQQFAVDLGTLTTGLHEILVGGYNNKKTATDESTEIFLDDIVLVRGNGGSFDPANDGTDTDTDGLCDAGDPDDDNDTVADGDDLFPLDPFACRDLDGDSCDDCTSGVDDVAADGTDTDTDGLCDAGDPDDDNDTVADGDDLFPLDGFACRDLDGDSCDDCTSGVDDVAADGTDTDTDGACDAGDLDDDNDGVDDTSDPSSLDPNACGDSDGDTCDDCSVGVDGFGPLSDVLPGDDGTDTDTDGLCDAGDPDDDNDTVADEDDLFPLDKFACRDLDSDSCDDCTSGVDDVAADGTDTDTDGACDAGDLDDDNDGVDDTSDPSDLDPNVCGDSDGDTCDDCSVGVDGFGPLSDVLPGDDGTDTDTDGLCDAGDLDDDNDGVDDTSDPSTLDPNACGDSDGDTCDDCSVGVDGFGPLSDVLPANDGTDTDTDGLCDAGDPDDDNDTVADGDDLFPLDPFACRDLDSDSCDDCTSGVDDVAADGTDTDTDGLCDAGDPDDDNDTVADGDDLFPLDPFACRDLDSDSCDDCTSGVDDVAADGTDTDTDGLCDAGDPDDDNDTVADGDDLFPLDPFACRDLDGDSCDDCTSGVDDVAADGTDTDTDGACDAGDLDDDNDGIDDTSDPSSLDPNACGDSDGDTCDDCSVGVDGFGPLSDVLPGDDGTDTDTDGACDAGDLDDDNDGIEDTTDPSDLDPNVCGDSDGDTCDDCSVGVDGFGPLSDVLPGDDGTDTDTDGLCDAGDPDDDNDTVADGDDLFPLDQFACRDLDGDSCDDCTSGVDDVAADGTDTDTDGLCDAGDPDDDNDTVADGDDLFPLDPFACRDVDGDSCDDCTSGVDDVAADGTDTDTDGLCDAGDPDDDNDTVADGDDLFPLDPFACRDLDSDSCDDCTSGVDDVAADGTDTDTDGACDAGDLDDDNDGIDDTSDPSSLDPNACGDSDGDTCDDCSVGVDGLGPLSDVLPGDDGTDTDTDGACDAGDLDDDNDGIEDTTDPSDLDPNVCGDSDGDTCDDCSVGVDGFGPLSDVLPGDDGTDTDTDGACDAGDLDDDNDGVDDTTDPSDLDPNVCGDSDGDTCDDCSVGVDGLGPLSDVLPGDDGTDTDTDGLCDAGDPDDDNDTVADGDDLFPLDPFACRDLDGDSCDDCTSGVDDVAADGTDTDTDGACDAGDLDDDNDGVDDTTDPSDLDPNVCGDSDGDTCDDCSVGVDGFGPLSDVLPGDDGTDTDTDGLCDAGDPDDDNDTVADGDDLFPLDPFACRDLDSDSCDDCTSGVDDVAADGTDTDTDGLCDAGDPDDDNDTVADGDDLFPLDGFACRDLDGDSCDDCTSGVDDVAADGTDTDTDGLCDAGDPDDDNDGTPDGSDCAPLVNSVASPVGVIGEDLLLGPAKSRLAWLKQPDANVYNLYRGSVAPLTPFGYNHACFATEVAALEATDVDEPLSGEVIYYLVSATNVCGGDGGVGTDSAGTPRPNTPCDPENNDSEGDGVLDINDNCPLAVNPLQEDDDIDQRGNACDNCPLAPNVDQGDADLDLDGDACDDCTDTDDDGFGDPGFSANTCPTDNCPLEQNPQQQDADADGLGDVCDECAADPNNDLDGDRVCGDVDNCPVVHNVLQLDADVDGLGDACDPCTANPDPGCVGCPDGTDADGDGSCQIGVTLAAEGSSIDYLANIADPGFGMDWVAEGFPLDASWQSGVYGVGFETDTTPPLANDLIATPVTDFSRSVYTLSTFDVASAAEVDRLAVAADYDDGYIVWINGSEAYRSPEMVGVAPLDWDARSTTNHEASNATDPDYGPPTDVSVAALPLLHDGTNTLAISVWNVSAGSSDLVLVPLVTLETSVDNCPDIANVGQEDIDGDGVGNLCDNCVNGANFDQLDADEDGLGDTCDPCPQDPNLGCSLCPGGTDPDGDGVCELETVLVEAGTAMDFLANSIDPEVGLTWVDEVFPLGPSWQSGIYGVGFDTSPSPNALGLIATTVTETNAASIYTRAAFELADPGVALRVKVGADYDDGYVVWLNGNEVYRSPQMPPTGDPLWDTSASAHESSNGTEPDYGELIEVTTAAVAALNPGTNTLALGVWNTIAGSSDLVVVPKLSINTTLDNCPDIPNPGQADTDGDGIGDACDPG